jgi:hypothetical protein
MTDQINFDVWVCKENAIENFKRARKGFEKELNGNLGLYNDSVKKSQMLKLFEKWFGK